MLEQAAGCVLRPCSWRRAAVLQDNSPADAAAAEAGEYTSMRPAADWALCGLASLIESSDLCDADVTILCCDQFAAAFCPAASQTWSCAAVRVQENVCMNACQWAKAATLHVVTMP